MNQHTTTQDALRQAPDALRRSRKPRTDPETIPALRALERLVARRDKLERSIADVIVMARSGGASYEQIGNAVGLTKQRVHQILATTPYRAVPHQTQPDRSLPSPAVPEDSEYTAAPTG